MLSFLDQTYGVRVFKHPHFNGRYFFCLPPIVFVLSRLAVLKVTESALAAQHGVHNIQTHTNTFKDIQRTVLNVICANVSSHISWDHTYGRTSFVYWIIGTDMKWVFRLRSKQLKWKSNQTHQHIHTHTSVACTRAHTNTHTYTRVSMCGVLCTHQTESIAIATTTARHKPLVWTNVLCVETREC